MRNIKGLVLVATMLAVALCLAGCAQSEEAQQDAAKAEAGLSVAKTPEGVIEDVVKDFESVESKAASDLASTKEKVGSTYDSYVANKAAITDWYSQVEEDSKALFERTQKNAVEYYKLVASENGTKKNSELQDELKDFYQQVYEDAFKGWYRAVYEDGMKDLYSTYYDGVLKDAYNTVAYKELSQEYTDFYRDYSDAQSAMYRIYSDAMSVMYRDYQDVSSAFYSGEYDVSKTLGLDGNR